MALTQRRPAGPLRLALIGTAVAISLSASPFIAEARAAGSGTPQPSTSTVLSDNALPQMPARSLTVAASPSPGQPGNAKPRPHALRNGLILFGSLALMAGAVYAGCRALIWLMRRKLGL
jgi:hypothetical protein